MKISKASVAHGLIECALSSAVWIRVCWLEPSVLAGASCGAVQAQCWLGLTSAGANALLSSVFFMADSVVRGNLDTHSGQICFS